jgi:hypothetical protein
MALTRGFQELTSIGQNVPQPPNMILLDRAPTSRDYRGIKPGDFAFNIGSLFASPPTAPTIADLWICASINQQVAIGAVWIQFLGFSSGLLSLTGDNGLPVFGDVNRNINLFGTGGVIVTFGTPADHKIVWSLDGSVAQHFTTDNGIATPVGNNLNIIANRASLGAGSTVLFSSSPPSDTVLFNVSDTSNNTIIGKNAGRIAATGTDNTGLGVFTLAALTSGTDNTAIGSDSSITLQSGSFNTAVGASTLAIASSANNNTAIGALSAEGLTTGSSNTLVGYSSGIVLTSGHHNIAIGNLAGSNWTVEANNIAVGTFGVALDSGVTRIGTNGTQTSCYVAGIDGVDLNTATIVTESADQLGTATLTAGAGISITPGAGTITVTNLGAGTNTVITAYTSAGAGNHALDANAKYITVWGWGAGSGGGSCRQGASTAAGGGGGGSGGSFFWFNAPAAFFGAGVVPYTVGAGGAGGAAQAVANTNGNNGSLGGKTSFGNIITDIDPTNASGRGGTTTNANGGIGSEPNNNAMKQSGLFKSDGAGGRNVDGLFPANSVTGTSQTTGGGGGAGADAVTERTGSSAGAIISADGITTILAGGTGGVESGTINGGVGAAGSTATFTMVGGTGGGGGGGQSVGLVAGNGGNGGAPGGGGGGGGGSLNGTNSGAGGAGADGALYVIEFL